MMKNKDLLAGYTTDFFVLRSPLLPVDHLFRLNSLLAEADGDRNFELALKSIYKDELMQDAIYLASPVLYTELLKYLNNELKDTGKLIDSLYQYYIRMTCRCTPFGLFAGTCLGEVSSAPTTLAINSARKIDKFLRLDMNYLCTLAYQLGLDKPLENFSYHANSSLYQIGNKLRYTETKFYKEHRTYQITNIDNNDLLALLLEYARTNRNYVEIITFITNLGIPKENAVAYTADLIAGQVLVNNLEANVTGIDYMDQLVAQLNTYTTHSEYNLLKLAVNEIKNSEGKDVALFNEVKALLLQLPAEIDESKLFQMDVAKQTIACNLNEGVLAEVKECATILSQLVYDTSAYGSLSKFKVAFEERYETSMVKLTTALDAEIGIDYQNIVSNTNSGSPDYNPGTNQIFSYKLAKYQHALKNNAQTITITKEDLVSLQRPINLPDSIGVMVKLHPDEKNDMGNLFQLEYKYASGPSAANILGRFCQSNTVMEEKVKAQLLLEELHHPNQIFAEIVHLPQARVGNVLARPHLRKYEIVFLAQSTLDSEYVITIDDLYLKMEYGKLVLFSKRLQKQIIPRLSNAHNYSHSSNLQIYQFLCDLQKEHQLTSIGWSWDFLSNQHYLPRVMYKNHILSPAIWNIATKRLSFLNTGNEHTQQQGLQDLFKAIALPTYVYFIEGDNELLLNISQPFTYRVIKKAFKKNKAIQFKESISQGNKHCVTDELFESYTNEIFIPLTKTPNDETLGIIEPLRIEKKYIRNYPIGSEWVYFQIYTGISTADKILRETLAKVLHRLFKKEIINKWFFIRYTDPKFHLRIRLQLSQQKYFSELLAVIYQHLNPLIQSGEISDLTMRTYKREVERYGKKNMLNSETLFFLNSNCVSRLLQVINEQGIQDQKLSIILYAIDQFIKDFKLTDNERLLFLQKNRMLFAREFRLEQSKDLRNQIQHNYRASKIHLEKLLAPGSKTEEIFKGIDQISAILATQSEALKQLVPLIIQAIKIDKIELATVLASYVHMYVNRLFPSNARFQEFIVYEFLERQQASAIARNQHLTKERAG